MRQGERTGTIFVTELLSNSSYRPIHDFIMGAEYVAVARIRQALADVPGVTSNPSRPIVW